MSPIPASKCVDHRLGSRAIRRAIGIGKATYDSSANPRLALACCIASSILLSLSSTATSRFWRGIHPFNFCRCPRGVRTRNPSAINRSASIATRSGPIDVANFFASRFIDIDLRSSTSGTSRSKAARVIDPTDFLCRRLSRWATLAELKLRPTRSQIPHGVMNSRLTCRPARSIQRLTLGAMSDSR